jgi:hypothetical protein
VLGQPGYDRESEDYLSRIRPREHEALIATVTCGISAIVAAPFVREFKEQKWLNRITVTTQAQGAQPVFAWIRCDLDTMRTYVRHRGAARDAGKLANWETYAASLDTSFEPPAPHVLINNSADAEPLQDQAKRLVQSLDRSGREDAQQ